MSMTTDTIIQRIKQVRKSKRFSIHDCATILGYPKKTYHSIEEGTIPLSLPELELLALYFGVSPVVFFEDDHHPLYPLLLKEDIRPHYLILRGKMIQAMLAWAQESKGYAPKDIEKATDIPRDVLAAYNNGDRPIPLQDLLKISVFLDIPFETLTKPVWEGDKMPQKISINDDWQPEFVETESNEIPVEEDPYQDMLAAFKSLPITDQAQILKILLDKLKS